MFILIDGFTTMCSGSESYQFFFIFWPYVMVGAEKTYLESTSHGPQNVLDMVIFALDLGDLFD